MNEEQLLLYLQQIVIEITESVGAKDFTKEQEQEAVKREIQLLLRRFGVTVEEAIPELLAEKYFGGFDEARRLLIDEGVNLATAAVTASTAGSTAATGATTGAAIGANGVIKPEFRIPIYQTTLREITNNTFLDLRAAIRTAEASAITTIDDAIANVKEEIGKGLIQGDPRKVMQAKVAKAFADGGLTSFTTSDNKQLPLDFYAMTVTRTKVREAAVSGAEKRYESLGQDLVQIRGNSDTCPICAKYRNMVVSLRGETPGYPRVGDNGIKTPPYHPNDRCNIFPINIKRKTDEEVADIKKHNAKYSPDKDPRTAAQKREYDKEQKKRRQARAEMQQFMRFNQVLGADNYKTLGAFRRAKKENSPKFQELQSAYRSAMANKSV